MFYYAKLNGDNICTELVSESTAISDPQYIAIPSLDQTLLGQMFNRSSEEFQTVYYYAVLDADNVVADVEFHTTQQTTNSTYLSITFEQYETITGLYWNGEAFVEPPISIRAIASTDEVNFKNEDKWLSDVLNEMIAESEAIGNDVSTVETNIETLTTSLTALSGTVANKADATHTHAISEVTGLNECISTLESDVSSVESDVAALDESVSALATSVAGKANASHTHTEDEITGLAESFASVAVDISALIAAVNTKADATHIHDIEDVTGLEIALGGKANASHTHTDADLSGVVKSINGTAPDASGNIVLDLEDMTAAEILAAIKTVDGAESGIDADTLDGKHATAFANASHNHNGVYATADHTHDNYLTAAALDGLATTESVNTALAGKSDTSHNHNSLYASIAHTHAMEDVTGLVTALAGKANADHNHNTAYAAIVHSHGIEDVTGLTTALAGKSDSSHNHNGVYATADHTHSQYVTTSSLDAFAEDVETALGEKSDTGHTHSQYATTTALSNLQTTVNSKANASHTHAQSDVTGLATALNGKANISHTHAQSDITGLANALNGKSNTGHTHTLESIGAAAANHTHTDNVNVEKTSSPCARLAVADTQRETRIYKNATSTADFGTVICDYDGSGARDRLTLCRNNALADKLVLTVQNADNTNTNYRIYGVHNKPTPADIGAAAETHTHAYLPLTGGTINGDLNVSGVIKCGGQQAFYYASSTQSQTLGTGNATGGTHIACGSTADVTVNGARMQIPSLLPRNGGTFQIGNTSNRFNGIYLKSQPNVSSDERLKTAIQPLDDNELFEFISKLKVVSYEYLGDETERIGLIAQDVIAANPNLAEKYFVEQDEDGYYSMRPADLVFALIAAVKELIKRI